MEFTNKNFLISVNSDEFDQYLASLKKDNIFYVDLDGKIISDYLSLYRKFDDVIGFPDYFGNNWNAFWDIMTDEYFITKDLIISIKNIDYILSSSSQDHRIFLKDLILLINTTLLDTKIQIFIIK